MMDLIQTRKRSKPKLSCSLSASVVATEHQLLQQCPMRIPEVASEEERQITNTKGFRGSLLRKQPIRKQQQQQGRMKKIVFGAIILTLICVLVNPLAEQRSEAKKIKEKKVLKSLVKGLIFKNLSTKKNFLPLPVPIPVPIELNEPPVYLKGKPKYVTIYKRTPVVKPVYQAPIYPSSSYMMDPYSLYASMMLAGSPTSYDSDTSSLMKDSNAHSTSLSGTAINFNDFDDEYGNYYIPKQGGKSKSRERSSDYKLIIRREGDSKQHNPGAWLLPTDEEEYLDHEDRRVHRRVKRQTYESSYENEPPCYGFPLEINVKSRIKMDQLFPIKGNSQFKKCIKVGRPLLPPVEDKPPYVHIFTVNKPY